jgi:Trypsin-like peptidase domain
MCRRLFIFFVAIVGASASAFADFVQLVARAKPAVVQLEVQTAEGFQGGTGFFISTDGYLVTNGHVIAGALRRSDIMATANDGTHYLVERIAYVDPDADIVILKFDCTDVASLQPELHNDVAEGQTVLVIGNPEGLQGTVSNGLVAAIRTEKNLIQITAPISPGSSGSPVLNEDGRVVGVAVGIFKRGQNLNFAIPVEEVRKGMLAISGLNANLPPGKEALQPRIPTAPYTDPSTAPDYQERVVAFVKKFVASGESGSRLPPPISFYGPNIVVNGRQISRQAMEQQIQTAFARFPERTIHIVSGPTVVGLSQDQAGSVVRYEVKFVFNNGQKCLEGKAAVQLTIELQGDELAITSIAPKIFQHTP